MQKRKVSWYKLKTRDSRSVKTLSIAEKSLIMSLPPLPFFLSAGILFSPLHPPSTPSPSVSRLHSSAMLTMWSTPTTRMLLQDHGLTVVPVDDSLNYSQRFPLRFHLPGITSLCCVIQDEISKCVYLRILLQCKINCWVYRYSFIVRLEVYRISL